MCKNFQDNFVASRYEPADLNRRGIAESGLFGFDFYNRDVFQ